MTEASTNRVSLSYVKEVTYGVSPGTQLKEIRYTGESLKANTGTVNSQEIRADRQIPDVIRNAFSADGDVNVEVSYGAHDDFLESALMSATWTGAGSTAGATNVAVDGTAKTFTRTTGSWVTDGFAAGEAFRTSGFTNAGNNSYFIATNVSATVITAQELFSTMVTESAGATVTFTELQSIVNGTTLNSYHIERKYEDLTNTFELLKGMCIDGMSMNIASDQIATGGFTFLGKAAASATATSGTGTIAAATTNPVLNGIDNVEFFTIGGVATSATAIGLQLGNNLRQRLQIGTLGAISVGSGSIDLTGTLQAYFANATLFDTYLAFTQASLALMLKQSLNRYLIHVPALRFTSGQRVAGGINQDVIADLAWSAYRHSTLGYTIRIARIAT